jgi:hypothetical protein
MEFKYWLFNEELYPQNNTAVVYHKTPTVENLKSILQNGFTKMERGTYGAGLYTYYKYEDNFGGNFNPTYSGGYGKILIKMKVVDIKRFLVLVEEEAKKIHGSDWLPSAQIKKLNIKVPQGYAEELDQFMTKPSRDMRKLGDEQDRFDKARGNTVEKLGPLYHRPEVSNLLMSKWAFNSQDNLQNYNKTSAEHPLAKSANKQQHIANIDWDAPLAATDSNCKGIIFYDPINNGGHNLLIYPPLNDITLLAYAFVPVDRSVPENQLKWNDLRKFNANFKTGLGYSHQKQKADVDPTNTKFQHDSLKIPSWDGLTAANVNTGTGEYVGAAMRGNLSHNDTVKASNDLVKLMKILKKPANYDDFMKNTKDARYKGILAEVLKNVKILTNFKSTNEILKYLTQFKKYIGSDSKIIETILRFYSNELDKNQYTNLMDALIQIMPKESLDTVVEKFLKPEIELKYSGDGSITTVDNRNNNSPVQLFQKIDVYKLIDLLNKKDISDDTLAKFIRYVDDQDKLKQVLGEEKYKKLLTNKNIYANPIDPDKLPQGNTRGMYHKLGRMEDVNLLKIKHQNGVPINDEDIIQVMKSEERSLNRLFEFLLKIKYPIKPEWYLWAIRRLSGDRLIAFVNHFGGQIVQALNKIDDKELQNISRYQKGMEEILLLRNLLSPEIFEKLKDIITQRMQEYFGKGEVQNMEQLQKWANEKPDLISQLSWGYNSLHRPSQNKFSPYMTEHKQKKDSY